MSRNAKWSRAKLKQVAEASGKPLEVRCAQVFLAAGWDAHLGSYFDDHTPKPLRELDVLVERHQILPAARAMTCCVRALVSCKDFPHNQSPLTYSVSTSCIPSFEPQLLSSFRFSPPGGQSSYGTIDDVGRAGAFRLLKTASLGTSAPLVAFDVVAREASKHKRLPRPPLEYKSLGDRHLFEGIDSALKAALYWQKRDYSQHSDFATLNVPICVFSIPFWDVCIDGGKAADPRLRDGGYQTLSLPRSSMAAQPQASTTEQPVVLVLAAVRLGLLIAALNDLFDWFSDEVTVRTKVTPPPP